MVNQEQGYYSRLAYYVTKVLSELPFNVVPAILFTLVLYAFVPLRLANDGIGWFMVLTMLESFAAATIGLAISACSRSTAEAINLLPPIFASM